MQVAQSRVLDVAFVPDNGVSGVTAARPGAIPEIKIYPNPAGDWLWVELDGTERTAARLAVVDVTGRDVFRISNDGIRSGERILWQLDVKNAPPGTYFLVLENGDGQWVRKFVKF